jgi:arylsulfatase
VGEWKAVRRNLNPGKGVTPTIKTELYHIATDRAESRDVADQHPELLARLETMMRDARTPSADFAFPILDAQ